MSDGGATTDDATTFTIDVTKPHPLFNAANPCDVNGDSLVAPNDALLVINDVNSRSGQTAGEQSQLAAGPGSPGFAYFDVNKDGFISPVDALIVINQVNSQQASGESTGAAATDAALLSLMAQDAADATIGAKADVENDGVRRCKLIGGLPSRRIDDDHRSNLNFLPFLPLPPAIAATYVLRRLYWHRNTEGRNLSPHTLVLKGVSNEYACRHTIQPGRYRLSGGLPGRTQLLSIGWAQQPANSSDAQETPREKAKAAEKEKIDAARDAKQDARGATRDARKALGNSPRQTGTPVKMRGARPAAPFAKIGRRRATRKPVLATRFVKTGHRSAKRTAMCGPHDANLSPPAFAPVIWDFGSGGPLHGGLTVSDLNNRGAMAGKAESRKATKSWRSTASRSTVARVRR